MIEGHSILLVGGAGKMGTALLRGLLESGNLDKKKLAVSARHLRSVEGLSGEGIACGTVNGELFDSLGTPVVVLCVHPDEVTETLAQLAESKRFRECPLLVSVATGIRTDQIESEVPDGIPVVRAMPNLPARIRAGVTVVCRGQHAQREHEEMAEQVFCSIGRVLRLDEKHMDAATGLAGCGPAYVFQILEGLAHGGVQVGLPREEALIMAAQTLRGAAELVLESGVHPAVLRDQVTTPGGCTVAALSVLEQLGLKNALIQAVATATQSARSLGKAEE
ncbi:MAG: pyrroline-5-carboxylate reductase [Planctomycetota bacterium]|jgi:pyrroline-5-carboxylate reductase|nr:pyrroline-5-carboxylate reductase [Planctomycetota bacterium]